MSATRPVDLEALRDAVQATCIERDGDYTLSSGEKSHYYYDGKRLALHPRWASLLAEPLADLVIESGVEAVGGMAVGAVPIAQSISLLAYEHYSREIPVFIVRQEKKEHGTKETIASAHLAPDRPLLQPGTKVAIVDDVVTKGGSIEKAIRAVEEIGCQVVLVAVIVERHEGGGHAIAARGYTFRRLFYTDRSGKLEIDESISRRYSGVPTAGFSSR